MPWWELFNARVCRKRLGGHREARQARRPITQSYVDEESGAHGPRPAYIQQVLFLAPEMEIIRMVDQPTQRLHSQV